MKKFFVALLLATSITSVLADSYKLLNNICHIKATDDNGALVHIKGIVATTEDDYEIYHVKMIPSEKGLSERQIKAFTPDGRILEIKAHNSDRKNGLIGVNAIDGEKLIDIKGLKSLTLGKKGWDVVAVDSPDRILKVVAIDSNGQQIPIRAFCSERHVYIIKAVRIATTAKDGVYNIRAYEEMRTRRLQNTH